QLAGLLDYRWSRRTTGVGRRVSGVGGTERENAAVGAVAGPTPDTRRPTPEFEIYQDVASKQREETLRQALLAGLEQRFQEEMAIGRELAGKSQEEMERLWEEGKRWNERLAKLTPQEQQALEHSPEGQAARKYQWLQAVWSPIQRVVA